MHNFILVNGDTDSISFKKPDNEPFTETEQTELLNEINSFMPPGIEWQNDKHYRRMIVVKAKNYILDDGQKVKVKGSGLKASKKEPALKKFTNEIIDLLLRDKKDQIIFTYLKYAQKINNISDMSEWAFKATVTKKILESENRTTFNQKIFDAIGSRPVSEGDKVYLFYKNDGSLCLLENFSGEYDASVLLGKLKDTADVFGTILDADLLPDFSLKRNMALLGDMGFVVSEPPKKQDAPKRKPKTIPVDETPVETVPIIAPAPVFPFGFLQTRDTK